MWVNSSHPHFKHKIDAFLHTATISSLEIRYTAEQIMESHRKELLKSTRHEFLEPSLKFYPYLLLEVKYTLSPRKTRESIMLWDLTDGEMVLDTKQWEKTHGFADCINAHIDANEFRIIKSLAKNGGSADKETLAQSLRVEASLLETWIENCCRKKLIVQSGNRYRLHLENPKLKVSPATQLDRRLVTKPYQHSDRIPKRFSLTQIERISQAAFGLDFVIRNSTDLYLPVHCITVQNPDGSIHSSHWNALNGKRLYSPFYD
jgi:hypothetical protein